MSQAKSTFEQHLEKLRADYRAQLPDKIAAIASDWSSIKNEWNKELAVVLHRNVHSLIGTSGTFGFIEISKTARELEVFIKPLLQKEDGYIPDTQVQQQIEHIIRQLTPQNTPEQKSDTPTPQKAMPQANQPLSQPENHDKDIVIYYLSNENSSDKLLAQNLISYGFNSKPFLDEQSLIKAIQHYKPNLVIIDFDASDDNQPRIFELAKDLISRDINVFLLSEKNDFTYRLQSVRHGIHAYINKPIDVPTLVGLIRSKLNLNRHKPTRILIVDDQESAAQYYSVILENVGMSVDITTNPLEVLSLLEATTFDLIILDLNMPEVNGDELAAVIRQIDTYQSIPILFLSADAAPEMKTSLLEIGSDDLLSKGMPEEELISHVKSRVARAKILTAMMYQDSLTGLLNHAQIQLAAERVFQHSRRTGRTFTIAMIDIDKFKKVNDTFGHLTGDKVIKGIAQLLQQRLRHTDYIGRFGGEEFLLVMSDINIHDAGNILNNLRKAFSSINFKSNDITFNVSFSAGIAENSGLDNFMEQIKVADEALYRAKVRGRNVVCASLSGEASP